MLLLYHLGGSSGIGGFSTSMVKVGKILIFFGQFFTLFWLIYIAGCRLGDICLPGSRIFCTMVGRELLALFKTICVLSRREQDFVGKHTAEYCTK